MIFAADAADELGDEALFHQAVDHREFFRDYQRVVDDAQCLTDHPYRVFSDVAIARRRARWATASCHRLLHDVR